MFAAAKSGKLTAPGAKRIKVNNGEKLVVVEMESKTLGNDSNLITKLSLNNRVLLGTRALLGKVDFCLRMHQQYPHADAVWDIYGKLVNIKLGKTASKRILLLRNDRSGPVMQALCNSAENETTNFEIGCYMRVVGRFVGVNRLRVYSMDEISEDVWQHSFVDVHELVENSLRNLQKPK